MEYPQNLLTQGIKFSIIGDNVAQIVLLPGEYIITQNNYIQYYSDNIEIKTKRSYFIVANQVTIVNNSKENVAYVGISAQTGKVMVLDAAIFNNYLIKESSILAANDFIEVGPIPQFQQNYQKIVFSRDLMKQQLIFLKTNGTVIDKDLGDGESITVQKHSILAMQDFVRYELNLKDNTKVKLIGPGRILFEINNQVMPNNLMLSRRRQLIHFFLLMSMLFFLSFVDIMLDIGAGV
ncbi:unnamed protein product [Paramecium primaurelia]|uniref:Uncharacterized protein n=2 Tax=Paramecium TaxID=5884 RepID=A0A8S1TP50_9CILI|nr:unnamed protein product [Paramecium primaurelia]CAD8155801.1 unnamed protein product [Paramecium pentaurelia]